ncbi:MAG: S-layer homology domain-containing protein [Eubacteriales bacterium]|nr:S-layer homology domain-containing protein [Eubacteriales bacterium]
MKQFIKKISMFFLALLLFGAGLFPSVGSATVFAAASRFSDVSTSYWGAQYIDFAASASIINGYPQSDGSVRFRPENAVSKEEAMQMLYKTVKNAKLATIPEGGFGDEYKDSLTAASIAPWAWECVSYGLKQGVLEVTELDSFRSTSGAANTATREEVARWAAKAVGGSLLPAVSFDFADYQKIKQENIYYVDSLVRKGILIGDNKNNFNPAANIKRVEYAVICKRLYALAEASFDPSKESRSYQGSITRIDKNENTLYLTETSGKLRSICLSAQAEIFLDGKQSTLESLPIGSNAVVSWGPFGQVLVSRAPAAGSGEISQIVKRSGDCDELAIMDAQGVLIYYFMSGEQTQMVGTPNVGDSIRFLADGMMLIELVVE